MKHTRKKICLTPVKDEAWILPHFLSCAEKWADIIIIADQASTDGSKEIAKAHPKVELIENRSLTFNEPERQKMLIEHARKIAPGSLLISLDADEAFTADFTSSSEWNSLMQLKEGTTIRFRWINLLPDKSTGWSPEQYHAWGFIDDGTPHKGNTIHSPRVPVTDKIYDVQDFQVLHYQYVHWMRMKSKQRWYMAWEYLHNDQLSTVKLHRRYKHMEQFSRNNIFTIPKPKLHTTDSIQIQENDLFRWDKLVMDMFDQFGTQNFSKVPLWDAPWTELGKKHGRINPDNYADPRSTLEVKLQSWLDQTSDTRRTKMIWILDAILRVMRF